MWMNAGVWVDRHLYVRNIINLNFDDIFICAQTCRLYMLRQNNNENIEKTSTDDSDCDWDDGEDADDDDADEDDTLPAESRRQWKEEKKDSFLKSLRFSISLINLWKAVTTAAPHASWDMYAFIHFEIL